MQWLDALGASLSFLSTFFFVRARTSAWFFTIPAVLINMYLYYVSGIYGDAGIELVYLISALYGLYMWVFGGDKRQGVAITHITWGHTWRLAFLALSTMPVLAFILSSVMHSQVPWLDAFTTVFSLIAQWLMCRKVIETWLVWFVVDVTYILLYATKALPFHSALSAVYTIMACIGYIHWYNLSSKQPVRALRAQVA